MPRCDRPRQCGRLPGRSRGRGVLHGPPRQVGGSGAGVEQFDVVIAEGGARISAAAVDLAHDDIRRARTCGGR